jgi:ribonuclease III
VTAPVPSEVVAAAARLSAALDLEFTDPALLQRALVHRSYAFENGGLATNERLEFLGDAVLALVVTDEIFHALPDSAEGRLAKVRAAAVKTASLADIARGIDLGAHVLLGKGEAVIGACYLDAGFRAAYDLVVRLTAEHLVVLSGRDAALDFKTSLQELVAARFESTPSYRLDDTGPDHAKTFTATVVVDGREVGTGTGPSKKHAEQAAAREAYALLEAEAGGGG